VNKTVIHSLTGLFVLGALLIAGLAIISRSTLRGWLGTVQKCESWLPEAYVKKGDAVAFRSFTVGRVAAVQPFPWHAERGTSWFKVLIDIDRDWADAVTDEFTLTVSVGPLGALTGSSLILLAPNELMTLDSRRLAERRGRALASFDEHEVVELKFQPPSSLLDELTDRARQMLDELGPQAEQVIAKVGAVVDELARPDGDLFTFVRLMRTTAEGLQQPIDDSVAILGEVRTLIQTMNDPAGSVQRMLGHAAAVGAAIEAGEGVVGGLLREGEIKRETVELFQRTNHLLEETRGILVSTQVTLQDMNASTHEVPVIVTGVRDLVAQLGVIVGRFDTASRVLPGLAEDLRHALEQTNQVLVGLRESALLGLFADFAPPPPGEPLVLPAALGGAR
jgi:ABC-type transporter Mla subunit MlaD